MYFPGNKNKGIIKVTTYRGSNPELKGAGVPEKGNAWKIEETIKSTKDSYENQSLKADPILADLHPGVFCSKPLVYWARTLF